MIQVHGRYKKYFLLDFDVKKNRTRLIYNTPKYYLSSLMLTKNS